MGEPTGFDDAVERLRVEFVKTERMSEDQEVLYFHRSAETVALVDLVAGVVQVQRPECFPSPIMEVGDVVALGFDTVAAAVWRAALHLDEVTARP
ncbi:MAG: hypothetical protein NVS1B12_17230 [Acidimicrobiales bacterium]